MKTVLFVTEHTGEYAHTPGNLRTVFNPDIHTREFFQATTNCIVSNDDWRPVVVPRYGLGRAEIPDWMDPDFYCRYAHGLRFFAALGGDLSWPEQWIRRFLSSKLDEADRYACFKLLKTKNFRSSFRQSMRDQLVSWLNAENPQYDRPFSPRQFDCVVNERDARQARWIVETVYRSYAFGHAADYANVPLEEVLG